MIEKKMLLILFTPQKITYHFRNKKMSDSLNIEQGQVQRMLYYTLY